MSVSILRIDLQRFAIVFPGLSQPDTIIGAEKFGPTGVSEKIRLSLSLRLRGGALKYGQDRGCIKSPFVRAEARFQPVGWVLLAVARRTPIFFPEVRSLPAT